MNFFKKNFIQSDAHRKEIKKFKKKIIFKKKKLSNKKKWRPRRRRRCGRRRHGAIDVTHHNRSMASTFFLLAQAHPVAAPAPSPRIPLLLFIICSSLASRVHLIESSGHAHRRPLDVPIRQQFFLQTTLFHSKRRRSISFLVFIFKKIIATSSPTGGTWLCNKNFPPFRGKCPYRRRCQLGRRRRQSHVVKTRKIDKHLATLPPAGVLVDTDAAADKPPTNKIRIIDAFNMQISNPKITKKHETINASLSRPVTQNGRLHIQISRPLFITSLIIHGR